MTNDFRFTETTCWYYDFISRAQKPSGEFPYTVSVGGKTRSARPHFQCYQYNAFECLNLMRYHGLSRDDSALSLISRQLDFLSGGLGGDGHASYDCGERRRSVTYHSAALAAAFAEAGRLGMAGYEVLSERAYSYVLRLQQ